MLIPSIKRIFTNDYSEEERPLVEKLSFPLNSNQEALFQTLNKNVDLKNNVYGDLKELTVSTNATGTPTDSISYVTQMSTSTIGIMTLRAINTTNSTIPPDSAPWITFQQSGRVINITNIKGLPANQQFILTIFGYG